MTRLTLLALLLALVMLGAVITAGSKAAVGGPQVAFQGSMCCAFDISGTFTLDHFEVKTPLSFPDLPRPAPQLVAVGTVTATRTDIFDGTTTTWNDTPFVWVNLSVSAACGSDPTVRFNQVGGSDYVGYVGPVGGLNLWDGSVPIAPWDPSVHWEVTADSSVTLTGTPASSCGAARVAGNPKALRALAANLDQLLRKGS